jgi:hypothetical protein
MAVKEPRFKGAKLKALLELYRRFAAKGREDPDLAKQKQENYARKVRTGGNVDFSVVKPIVKALGINEYALVGGQAAIEYGSRRTTVDVDILASSETIREVLQRLGAKPDPVTIGGFTIVLNNVDVDLLHWNDPVWLEDLLDAAVVQSGLRIVSRPWLLFLKLLASRDIDIIDIQAVLRGMDDDEVDDARRIITKHAPTELDDFESFVALDKWDDSPEKDQ